MSWKRSLIEALDRPGGRGLLSLLATTYARRTTGRDVSLVYDDVWLHRCDSDFIPLSHLYDYAARMDWPDLFETQQSAAEDFWFFLYKPEPGHVIVDIGAGDGSDLPTFSRAVGHEGRVVAVEAHPRTFRLLRASQKWNRLANVTIVERAIMDHAGEVHIEDQERHLLNAVRATPRLLAGWKVAASTLDELCDEAGITRIDFLKMNIEGAERHAIRGAERTLHRVRHVCIACHDFLGTDESVRTRALVIDFLRERGFRTATRDNDPRDYVRDHVHGVKA